MDDLISRQAAIDEIEYELEMINSALDSITLDFNARERLRQRKGEAREILNSIQQLPSVQPEQKKGKWIYPSGIVGFGRCPECKALWDYSLITNRFFRHCPRCGAKIENSPFKDTEREEEE